MAQHTSRTYSLVILIGVLVFSLLACKAASKLGLPVRLGPLDEETLEQLRISSGERSQAQPGESLDLEVGIDECCYVFTPVDVRTRWSVSPEVGATIDSRTGELQILPDTPPGTTFTIQADIETGRKVLTAEIHVYTPESNPLVGVWGESQQISCESGQPVEGQAEPIRELVFNGAGDFTVTWTPFEIYHDYWGTYTLDVEQGTLAMAVESGNYVPEGLDLEGTFSIDPQGQLWLKDIWLGQRGSEAAPNCGHIFVR